MAKAKKTTAKKAAAKTKKSAGSKVATKTPQKAVKKTVKKAAPKAAQKTNKKASAPKKKAAAPKASGGSVIETINQALETAVALTLEIGDMEVGQNGVTEKSLEDAVARLAKARRSAWDLLMATFPDLIDRLMFTEMIEGAYQDEEAGAIRFAGSAVGWDEVGGQFVLMGTRGDVWEGEGKLLEAVMAGEMPEAVND